MLTGQGISTKKTYGKKQENKNQVTESKSILNAVATQTL
jgi:hypothetical protein